VPPPIAGRLISTLAVLTLGTGGLVAGPASKPVVGHVLAASDSPDSEDLAFLPRLLEGKRLVQLGENGHGEAEAMRVRVRIARFLHGELGFGVLAFESSLFLGHYGDGRAGSVELSATLVGSTIGVWHTREMLPLVELARDSRATPRPLRLAGFDI
jgi:erythromycin esterase